MNTLRRNAVPFWYCQYVGIDDGTNGNRIIDAEGNETGEIIINYARPVKMYANISPASGTVQSETFGNLEQYDKVIVTGWVDCPIDENTVLFVDKAPEFAEVKNDEIVESDALLGEDEVVPHTYVVPLYDYVVRRVSKSLNSVSIAISKVAVS